MPPLIRINPALLRRWPLPALDSELGKVARGKVLVVGGSDEIPGAAVLAALAALRAGAGTLAIATTRLVAPHVAVVVPEARVIGVPATRQGELAATAARLLHDDIGRCNALLVGPGMLEGPAAGPLLATAARSNPGATVVVDAGALAAVRALRTRPDGAVITPHVGEMAKLCGVDAKGIAAHAREHALETAAELGVVVVLKGATTYIAAPDGTCYANVAGNLGLGTSGSGDTLSGVIAGLGARGATPLQAAVWGVHVHAKAGELLARRVAPLGFLARELLDAVPGLVARFAKR
ncbi:MAG TPA: NAD(P)H-hydrate dehydratase [Kofleriaceae bacterium]|nr:NAD(P)H-hydrate dehydratase [Kofleriaceae bacterium]